MANDKAPHPSTEQQARREKRAEREQLDRLGRREQREQLERLAWMLDDAIRIPVIGYRIGIDPIIGLIPGVGDALGGVLSSYIVFRGAQMGASTPVLVRMSVTALIGVLVGMIPFAGDLFDAVWKANDRNVRLLKRHLDDPERTTRSSRWVNWATLGVLLLVIAGVVALGVLAIDWLFDVLFN